MKSRLTRTLAGAALAALLSTTAFAEVVYNRGNSADPESLDPHKTSTVYEAHILRDLFQGLVMQDAKAELIPGAAESWTISDDGTVYTFKLRDGANWSNGDPVTADDFVYSLPAPAGSGDGGRVRLHALRHQERRGGEHRAAPSPRTSRVQRGRSRRPWKSR